MTNLNDIINDASLSYRKSSDNNSNYFNKIGKKMRNILGTGLVLAVLSGCPSPTGPSPTPPIEQPDNGDNGDEQDNNGDNNGDQNGDDQNGDDQNDNGDQNGNDVLPPSISVTGLDDIIGNNYVDVRPDKSYISGVNINFENADLYEIGWEKNGAFGNIIYDAQNGILNFDSLPSEYGNINIFVKAYGEDDTFDEKYFNDVLFGPERAYFIGDVTEFNSEYGSLDSFLETERFGGNIGDSFESQYLRDDVNYIFEGLPFAEHLAESSEFYAGKDSNGDHYILAIDENGFTAYEVTESEFNEIYDRSEEALVLGY